jgi:Protein of unknown function (DUF3455)
MKQFTTITLCAALLATACASPLTAQVPEALKPAANETLAMIVAAKGVQIYECRNRKDGAGVEWAFVAPDADLFDARGLAIGRHGAGPYWQARDGSRIVGTLQARADAPNAGAIPWLLLVTKSTGPDGTFAKVTSIQRINTVGGLAPSTPCTRETTGTSARIDYTADYLLFAPR